MKSPFPGMDPYLEARWSDVHASLIFLIKEALTPHLPAPLRARSEEEILVEESEAVSLRRYRADVAVVRSGRRSGAGREGSSPMATLPKPYVIEFVDAPIVDRSIRIIDVENGNRLVTVIELLSPWNKASGRLNERYLRKLDDFTQAGVSIVEIDLLRSSRARLKVVELDLPPEGRAPYLICVQKGWRPGRWEAYPIELRRPIPPIMVPLRKNDKEIILQTQPLLERVYVAGGYDDIDYAKPPDPPLSGADAKWARELLRKSAASPGRKRRSGRGKP